MKCFVAVSILLVPFDVASSTACVNSLKSIFTQEISVSALATPRTYTLCAKTYSVGTPNQAATGVNNLFSGGDYPLFLRSNASVKCANPTAGCIIDGSGTCALC
jgi:hypothetical protein